jgi:hypothetical protein
VGQGLVDETWNAISKSASVDAAIEKLADDIQEKHLRLTGQPLRRGDAISQAMAKSGLFSDYRKSAYGPDRK